MIFLPRWLQSIIYLPRILDIGKLSLDYRALSVNLYCRSVTYSIGVTNYYYLFIISMLNEIYKYDQKLNLVCKMQL